MVANSAKTAVALFLIFLVPISSAIEGKGNQDEVISYLTDNLLSSIEQMGKAIEACDQKSETRSAPVFDKDRLTELNASRENLLTALAHLSFANHFECTRKASLAMAYDLGTLVAVQKELGIAATDLGKVHQEFSYPSARTVHYAAMYKELPVDLKKYLEKIVGQEPFELVEVLKINDIFSD